jgi:acyl-CoA reductase-like NAD-dependent aldehyde dehydrogenase
LISERQRDRVHQVVTASIDRGAKLNVGGSHKGLFYRLSVLSEVHPDMPAFDEEIFGPVAPVVIADADDHAISLANATEYGLSAAIQTGSLDRGMRLAERLRAGMVHVNDQTINDLTQCRMGRFGQSGNGARFGSLTNRDEFSEWQWLTRLNYRQALPAASTDPTAVSKAPRGFPISGNVSAGSRTFSGSRNTEAGTRSSIWRRNHGRTEPVHFCAAAF